MITFINIGSKCINSHLLIHIREKENNMKMQCLYACNRRDASLHSHILSSLIKNRCKSKKMMLLFDRKIGYRFILSLCVHRILLCLHHSSRISFIFRFYLPFISPPFLSSFHHIMSNATAEISDSLNSSTSIYFMTPTGIILTSFREQ